MLNATLSTQNTVSLSEIEIEVNPSTTTDTKKKPLSDDSEYKAKAFHLPVEKTITSEKKITEVNSKEDNNEKTFSKREIKGITIGVTGLAATIGLVAGGITLCATVVCIPAGVAMIAAGFITGAVIDTILKKYYPDKVLS